MTHGMAGNAHWWDQVAPALSEVSRPVALDFQGHGDSEWDPQGNYEPESFVESMETARQVLGWEKMAIGSHSFGARVALDYARKYPNRVSALIAIDFLPEFYEAGSRRFERARNRRQPVYQDVESMLTRFHLEPAGTLLDVAALRDVAQHCLRKTEKGYSWKFDWRAFLSRYEPIWSLLPEIKVPTLIVRGEHSKVISQESFNRVVREISGASGVEIARAHHHVPLDCPSVLAAEMAAFLQKI